MDTPSEPIQDVYNTEESSRRMDEIFESFNIKNQDLPNYDFKTMKTYLNTLQNKYYQRNTTSTKANVTLPSIQNFPMMDKNTPSQKRGISRKSRQPIPIYNKAMTLKQRLKN